MTIKMVDEKKVRINITVNPSQYEIWKKEASHRDMSLSSFIRHCVTFYLRAVEKYKKSK